MKKPKKHNEPIAIPQMPFDDALKKLLGAPPQHKEAKPKKGRRKK